MLQTFLTQSPLQSIKPLLPFPCALLRLRPQQPCSIQTKTFLLVIFFKKTIKISLAYGGHLSPAWEPAKMPRKVPKGGKSITKMRHDGRRMYNLLLFHVIKQEAGGGGADFWSGGTDAACTGAKRLRLKGAPFCTGWFSISSVTAT